jgi:uncharacterized membrane protein
MANKLQSTLNKSAWAYARKLNNKKSKGSKKYFAIAMRIFFVQLPLFTILAGFFTVKQLLIVAKSLGIKGRHRMRKTNLIQEIFISILTKQNKSVKNKQYSFKHKA